MRTFKSKANLKEYLESTGSIKVREAKPKKVVKKDKEIKTKEVKK